MTKATMYMEDTVVMTMAELAANSDTDVNLERMAIRLKVEAANWLTWQLSFKQRSKSDWMPVRKNVSCIKKNNH